eukprot:scaffold16.g66.t1
MILTDAMALLYRSHFAFGEAHRLRTAAGEDTTVLFGFLNTLLNLLELSPAPTHFAVVFDAAGKNFRHELYSGYKGQRPETPDAIRVPGVEADDVIGTLALRGVQASERWRSGKEEGMAVAVASPDKDFMQLLRPGLILLRPPKKAAPAGSAAAAAAAGAAAAAAGWVGPDGSRVSKFALVPFTEAHFREVGVGPKTAAALLRQFGSLESILEHAGTREQGGLELQHAAHVERYEPSGQMRLRLPASSSRPECKPRRAAEQLGSEAGAAAARLSRQLVEIRTDLDLPPLRAPLDALRLARPADGGAAAAHQLESLEFKVHAGRLRALWAGPAFQAG